MPRKENIKIKKGNLDASEGQIFCVFKYPELFLVTELIKYRYYLFNNCCNEPPG